MWFEIKCKPTMQDGSKHVFTIIKLLRTQPNDVQAVAQKSVQTNAYFAHSSNLFVAMLSDEEESIRRKAINTILDMRSGKIKSKVKKNIEGIRIFRVPKLNWNAQTFVDIIDWDPQSFSEPSVIRNIFDDELREGYKNPICCQITQIIANVLREL